MKLDVLKYPEFILNHVKAESSDDIPSLGDEGFTRVELPYHPDNVVKMAEKGYVFADRTLGAVISLKRKDIDYQRLIRFEVRREEASHEDILDIALNSFPWDRRFHVSRNIDDRVAEPIIRNWVENLSEVYVCAYKDQIVGFLDLEPYGETDCFIHLAAVRKEYRAVGAAASLYAYAILAAREKGCERVVGRISSGNTAVMNLYARLGGVIGDPIDVFVKDEIK